MLMKTLSVFSLVLFSLTCSACSFTIDRFSKDGIEIETLPPVESNKLDCDTKDLTKLELTKCKMNAKLLELNY